MDVVTFPFLVDEIPHCCLGEKSRREGRPGNLSWFDSSATLLRQLDSLDPDLIELFELSNDRVEPAMTGCHGL